MRGGLHVRDALDEILLVELARRREAESVLACGARGLWMDMLAVAAQNDPVGYIVVRHGKLATMLSRVAGIPEEQAEAYFCELFDAGVIHLDEHGRMFDPRMIRDNENLQKAITSGRRGGRKSRDRKKGIFKPSEGASG